MKRGNIAGRLARIEAEAVERGRPDAATMSEEERYYRVMLILARAKQRIEDGWVNPNRPDPEESRRRHDEFERMRPRLVTAEARIETEAERMGLSVERYLRRRFPWVSYSERSS